MGQETDVRYLIGAQDEIIFVDEGWRRFAEANDGSGLLGDGILGRSLWDFIGDRATRQLYRKILTRVRKGLVVRFNLRCDGPGCRRFTEMTIRPLEADTVEFTTQTFRIEQRDPLPFPAPRAAPSAGLLSVCSWCNRIAVASGEWVEVEEAVARLRLFELDRVPQMTHGICEDCLVLMTSKLTEMTISV